MLYNLIQNKIFSCNYKIEVSYPIFTDDGLPLISLGVIQDITNYKNNGTHNCSLFKHMDEHNELIYNRKYPSIEYLHITEREIEILTLLANGFNTIQISTKLFISMETIKSHRRNILKKLGAKNIAEAIKIASLYDFC